MSQPNECQTSAPGHSAAPDPLADALDALARALDAYGLGARRIDRTGAPPVLAVINPDIADLRDVVVCQVEDGTPVFFALCDPPPIRLGHTVEHAAAALGRMLTTPDRPPRP